MPGNAVDRFGSVDGQKYLFLSAAAVLVGTIFNVAVLTRLGRPDRWDQRCVLQWQTSRSLGVRCLQFIRDTFGDGIEELQATCRQLELSSSVTSMLAHIRRQYHARALAMWWAARTLAEVAEAAAGCSALGALGRQRGHWTWGCTGC